MAMFSLAALELIVGVKLSEILTINGKCHGMEKPPTREFISTLKKCKNERSLVVQLFSTVVYSKN